MVNKIIKKNAVVDNDWLIIVDATINDLPKGNVAIPMAAWERLEKVIAKRNEPTGLLINSDENPGDFTGKLSELPLIAVNFLTFSDGRGFSLGSLLRNRYGYKGEMRAKGGFIRDQLYYLKRCGFESFEFDGVVDLETAKKSLSDFSDAYQYSSNQSSPLFRRRAKK